MGFLSAIGPLASLAGSFLSSRASSRAAAQGLAFSQRQFDTLQHQSIQNRVADARKAGIHPLAALGMSPSGSTVSYHSGAASGSAFGEGIAAAGAQVADLVRKKPGSNPLQQAQIRAANAAAERDEAQAALTNSQRKRAEQFGVVRGLDWPALATSGALGPTLDAFSAASVPKGGQADNSVIPPMHWDDIVKKGSLVTPGGARWETSPDSMTSSVEEHYGDVAGSLVGLVRFFNDLRKNLNRYGAEAGIPNITIPYSDKKPFPRPPRKRRKPLKRYDPWRGVFK